jgi:hypothetical protein
MGKGKVMKTVSCALLILATLVFILPGCSDESVPPVSATDLSGLVPGALQKSVARDFTANMSPTGVTDAGIYKYPDGKVMLKGLQGPVYLGATFFDGPPDLITGSGEIEINGLSDFNTGVGQWYGKVTLHPAAPEAAGGVWEITWHGTATLTGSGWILPLKEEGHGKGGALTGMQCRLENTIVAPPDLSTWSGTVQGVIISH